jgi:hypothetical protein
MESLSLTKRSRSKLQELAGLALEYFPITFSASDRMPGHKAFFGIPLKEEPKDPIKDDVTDLTGVYVFKKQNGAITGETHSLGILVGEITDLSLRNRIMHRVEEIRQMIHLDDDFLTAANIEWAAHPSDLVFGFKTLQ